VVGVARGSRSPSGKDPVAERIERFLRERVGSDRLFRGADPVRFSIAAPPTMPVAPRARDAGSTSTLTRPGVFQRETTMSTGAVAADVGERVTTSRRAVGKRDLVERTAPAVSRARRARRQP
jgi:hypothetical protein